MSYLGATITGVTLPSRLPVIGTSRYSWMQPTAPRLPVIALPKSTKPTATFPIRAKPIARVPAVLKPLVSLAPISSGGGAKIPSGAFAPTETPEEETTEGAVTAGSPPWLLIVLGTGALLLLGSKQKRRA
jgi:hypothetical protein